MHAADIPSTPKTPARTCSHGAQALSPSSSPSPTPPPPLGNALKAKTPTTMVRALKPQRFPNINHPKLTPMARRPNVRSHCWHSEIWPGLHGAERLINFHSPTSSLEVAGKL
ncbi:hypothetical protein PISMIDRAFT_688489 [Pisolithus microcarpus 441]|uniref:Uncharacterized protein n=1 Tax=Pisolithus microcarpus 441 TaxID=765257 RepID=A0A0C9XMQ4_9AGAM|nr:hypothetical protein PISMIDRAFT_688489 [Pisolithus microcarpus 441]